MKKWLIGVLGAVLLVLIGVILLLNSLPQAERFGYARPVSEEEAQKRQLLIATAEAWLGCKDTDGSHRPIIDLYNSHRPLAENYTVTYTDKWCATFVSAAAIQCGMTDIIPTECGCHRQIGLFRAMGCWEEADTYIPLPGDVIYYSEKGADEAENTGWSDHVGIVVGTSDKHIKVLEGNYNGEVQYRYVRLDDPTIRGYGLPDYSA